ncbi:hypothetical protein [Blattabacterium cuenoti]|uniref:hypothetical protein n=1 Tax=Blattabacterium cuenoti TaxID=1653831 RepID=UPI001EEBB8A7|nr:hypothetical protein [Blattabacterium cuenoti]
MHKFSKNLNPVDLYFFKNEIKFSIEKNKIFFVIPYELKNRDFLIIQTNFVKYFKKKLYIKLEIVKRNSNTIKKYNLLYKKNKLIETLIERLNLKNSCSEITKNIFNDFNL